MERTQSQCASLVPSGALGITRHKHESLSWFILPICILSATPSAPRTEATNIELTGAQFVHKPQRHGACLDADPSAFFRMPP